MLEDQGFRAAARWGAAIAALGLLTVCAAVSAGPAAAAPDVSVTLCHATAPSVYVPVTIAEKSAKDLVKRINREYPAGANPTDVIPSFDGFAGRNLSGGGQELLANGCLGIARPADINVFICHWNPEEFFEPGSVIVTTTDGGYQMSWIYSLNWNGHVSDANDIVPVLTAPSGEVLLPGRNLTPDTQAYLGRGCADPGATPPPSPAPSPEVTQVTDDVVVPVSAPEAATVPTAVPSGGGSSVPDPALSGWGAALIAGSALAAAGAGLRLVATRRGYSAPSPGAE